VPGCAAESLSGDTAACTTAALQGGTEDLEAVYSGAKGAVVSFTKTLAREVAKNGITVNTVCPGPTLTPALEGAIARNPKILESMVRAVPMGRVGQPDDVATAVAFFGSDEASFITGQTLSVSGGLTMA